MKLAQLTEYKLINIFLEKASTKCGEETSTRPFLKKPKQGTSHTLDYQNILKLKCWLIAFTSYKAF